MVVQQAFVEIGALDLDIGAGAGESLGRVQSLAQGFRFRLPAVELPCFLRSDNSAAFSYQARLNWSIRMPLFADV